jgi:hypothetical protein
VAVVVAVDAAKVAADGVKAAEDAEAARLAF